MGRTHRSGSRLPRSILALIALAPALATPAGAASGAPDAAGYRWEDSDEPGIAATVPAHVPEDLRTRGFTGDEKVIAVALPRSVFPAGFRFYGISYTSLWLSSNGWLSFVNPAGNAAPLPASPPAAGLPDALVAFLWDDWSLEADLPLASAGPTEAGDGFVIRLHLARPGDPARIVGVTVLLLPTGEIRVVYDGDLGLVGPLTTIGIENAAGTTGTAYMVAGVPQGGALFRPSYALSFGLAGGLACQPAARVPCPLPSSRSSNAGGGNLARSWGCSATPHDGNDRVFEVVLDRPTDLHATLGNPDGRNRDLFLLGARCNERLACLAGGATTLDAPALPAGTYRIVVDGVTAADNGPFDLALDCVASGGLVCPRPPQQLDLSNPLPVAGDTTGKPATAESYTCTAAGAPPVVVGGLTGPEEVYEFTVTEHRVVTFLLESSSPDLRLLILDDCSESRCVVDGGCAQDLAPGRYRLVVDGLAGAAAPYTLRPVVLPSTPRNPWFACPECLSSDCTGSPGDVSRTIWSFDSQTYCGTGCDFSLYAVVECGTEFHVPFYDVETGHLRIYDVLGGRDVSLTATNLLAANPTLPPACELTATGTVVGWEDRGCDRIPCPGACGGGADCRTNEVVMDVSFAGTPTVCGVYRLDFLDWGGWTWEVYANCSADRTPTYPIYRDLCSALSAYQPLPEVGISDLVVDRSQCDGLVASGTFVASNVGCSPAAGIELVIEQLPPLPANPQRLSLSLLPGETRVVPWSYAVTDRPSSLRIRVDPDGRTAECSESLGGAVQCGDALTLVREVEEIACPLTCQSQAEAGPALALCEGEPAALDGSASRFACLVGTAEYRWEDAASLPLAGCDWSSAATCTVLPADLPAGSHVFTLRTRCAGDLPGCESSAAKLVDVTAEQTPGPIGNTLRAIKAADLVNLSWAAAPLSTVSSHRIYRDDARDLGGTTRTAIADVAMPSTVLVDPDGVQAPPRPIAYYQVVGRSCSGALEGPY